MEEIIEEIWLLYSVNDLILFPILVVHLFDWIGQVSFGLNWGIDN